MKPEKYPWMAPCIIVKDLLKSIDFYESALEFILIEGPLKNKNDEFAHAVLKYNDTIIMINAIQSTYAKSMKIHSILPNNNMISLYMYCNDVDSLYKKSLENKAISISKPVDMPWGERMAIIEDINNYRWCLASIKKE